MPEQNWLLSEVALPSTLLLLSLCHILHHASKAIMNPYGTGLGINSLKNNTANKEGLSHYPGTLFSHLVNEVGDPIQLKSNYKCSTGTLPSACSLHSHASPVQEAAALVQEQVVATQAVMLPKGCSNCALTTIVLFQGKANSPRLGFFGLVWGAWVGYKKVHKVSGLLSYIFVQFQTAT